ncbi:SDR family NAD(P)-dependent oxidoreductase [Solicola gregarius]|uniref:SDR family NAD(P)-dependent oxidoreductase n=1 Tax=Solicola gregarius TaxID=2908642 RepID=A0AA46TII9_9ACTN|nr:SDR family NAD(P)-dependent oxidoreductase [Solicola gregarius]UYM05780.1 SDR family NAD(P)-dependent oxidoreductase [Solicola gregarius]
MTPRNAHARPNAVVIGAGPGIGFSTARRFAIEGYDVGLVSRTEPRLRELAARLSGDVRVDGEVAYVAADAGEGTALRNAILELEERLGPTDVLVFCPLPDVDLIKPVLDTTADDLVSALTLGVGGATTAVSTVVEGMLERRHGSLLFTTGSGATQPSSDRAASAVATTAAAAYFRLLRDALRPSGVNVAHLTIRGAVGPGLRHEPDAVADMLWDANRDPGDGFPGLGLG